MNVSLLKHVKQRTDNDFRCIDDHAHTCILKLTAADAIFVLKFDNISKPAAVKQVSGKDRKLTQVELKSAENFLSEFLYGAIGETLLEDETNVLVAKKITRALGHDSFFKHLILSKKLMVSGERNFMLAEVANATGLDIADSNGLVVSIVNQVTEILKGPITEKRVGV